MIQLWKSVERAVFQWNFTKQPKKTLGESAVSVLLNGDGNLRPDFWSAHLNLLKEQTCPDVVLNDIFNNLEQGRQELDDYYGDVLVPRACHQGFIEGVTFGAYRGCDKQVSKQNGAK